MERSRWVLLGEVGVQRGSEETEVMLIWNVTGASLSGRFLVCAWPVEEDRGGFCERDWTLFLCLFCLSMVIVSKLGYNDSLN